MGHGKVRNSLVVGGVPDVPLLGADLIVALFEMEARMATVFDVAKYILDKLGPMTTWKLQKLCYYAQAWTLAWDGEPLFEEEFEAWSNGPVCRGLFNEHKGLFTIGSDELTNGNAAALRQDQKENVDTICCDYGSMDAYWLREQTHGEVPWKDARGNLPVGAPGSNIIAKSAMGEYYGSL